MELIVNTISFCVLIVLEIILYLILASKVLPLILKMRYDVSAPVDRGLHKYVYPEGRGISYEPQPSVRKYINRYLLFTNNGYKYLKCRIDEGVHSLSYTVLMFNNKNKIIDAIDVESRGIYSGETENTQVHQDTSYVAVVLNSVNGEKARANSMQYYKIRDVLIYALSMTVLCFAQLAFIKFVFDVFDKWWFKNGITDNLNFSVLAIPSIAIGALVLALLYLNCRKKNVRWSK